MLKRINRLVAIAATLLSGFGLWADLPADPPTVPNRTAAPTTGGDKAAILERATRRRTLAAARASAATRAQASLKAKGGKVDPKSLGVNPAATKNRAAALRTVNGDAVLQAAVPGPGFQLPQPDYMFGTASNWHNTKPIRKFVDTLPGLGPAHANNLGNFIPVAQPVTGVYSDGSDYYEMAVVEYTQKVHSDLQPTRFRGYKDTGSQAQGTTNGGNSTNYLGPVIIAHRDKPVRVKLTNQLPFGPVNPATGRRPGDLFIPVDTTMMGAGTGPLGGSETYTENRAELHLHGALSPWISDGTPHQWITPAGETTSYKKGAAFQHVPDMVTNPTPDDGTATYYWTNQQSGRLMFYHDHTFGLTRLNVYAGEAAGYLIVDPVDEKLINAGILPDNGDPGGVYRYGIPLIIQDKTFVDTSTLGTVGVAGGTDPTWDVNVYGGDGSLWYPHVYMPNQNPADISGASGMGRWDYGPWFWPPVTAAAGLKHGAEPVVGDPNGTEIPGTPNPSLVPEAFLDTPLVNGTPYPKLTVQPQAYRFRILNAANDRMWNLSFFEADATGTEVAMVPAAPGNPAFPATWPTDGRDGGVPDPTKLGPSIIQIGNESGFLPAPVVIAPQPVAYNYNRRDIVVLNVQEKALFLGPAERADVIVDFSAYAGKKLILYNDAPAPVPAFDARLDYYTGSPDQRDSGGAAPTQPGYGPNTRTIMLIEVAAATPAPAFDLAALNAAFQSTATSNGAFAEAQHLPIVPQVAYAGALNRNIAKDVYVRIQDNAIKAFPAMEDGTVITPALGPKAIQELFELDYGRMNATLGVELPFTNFNIQTTIPLGYSDPATELLTDGTTQYWKITHNGVDTHPVHFHLFDVQVINRVGWDGAVRLPDANEIGWKETLRMNPLEDIIVAFRPLSPRLPFQIPNSLRSPNVVEPANASISVTSPVDGNPVTVTNAPVNFGWEYVWHCHILGHEENDFMRPMVLSVASTPPDAPTALTATLVSAGRADLAWTDNASNETGFAIQRSVANANTFATIGTAVPNMKSYSDFTVVPSTAYDYRVIAYNQAGESAPSNLASVNTPTTVQLSGLITTFNGTSNQPLAGVSVAFNDGSTTVTATTDANGVYSLTAAYHATGTLTASLAGYAFAPLTRTLASLITNQSGLDFVAHPVAIISGTVTPALAGVTIQLSNGGGSAVTDNAGAYSIAVSSGWTGVATPVLAGYIFSPASRNYSNVVADQPGQNYTATAVVTISGAVTNGVTPVAGVNVAASTGETTVTDANGLYSLTLTAPWSGTITPTKANFAFTPAVQTYSAISSNQTLNFAASAVVVISGHVTNAGNGLAGVTLTPSNGAPSVVTDAMGAYTLTLAAPFTGTVTPSLAGFLFTPVNHSYAAVTADQLAQDFTATAIISVTGQVTLNGAPLSGVAIVTSTGQTALTDVTGAYALVLPSPYSGTLTPAKPGYSFAPVAIGLANATVDQVNQNFAATNGVTVYGLITTNAVPPVPLAGVTVTFSNGAGSVVTDAAGVYTHYVPSGWSGTLTPSLVGWAFTPASRNLTNVVTSPAGQNFSAGQTYLVSGTITSNGLPQAGVRVALSNGGGSFTTGADGTYSLAVRAGWTGTITPTLRGFIYQPALVTISTPLVGPLTQNFITVQTISGRTRDLINGNSIPNVTITATGTTNATAISDANGNFTLRVPTGWSGSLSASGGGYTTWTPTTSVTYTNLITNVTGLRFIGSN
ncbi:MAG: multicopper oxidase domain-containing protein [Firmicutes bacterium]|nr:multicopper oxidase domain-containing protein [Bacillota bacterium]